MFSIRNLQSLKISRFLLSTFIHFYPVLSTFSQIYHFFFDFLEYGKKIAVFSIISTLNRQCKKFELQHYQYYTTIFFRVNSCIQHQKFGELTASVTTVTTQKTGSCDRCWSVDHRYKRISGKCHNCHNCHNCHSRFYIYIGKKIFFQGFEKMLCNIDIVLYFFVIKGFR
jgi:hypothetical protein